MPYALTPFNAVPLTESRLRGLIDAHTHESLPRLQRFWRYYRNPTIRDRDPRTGQSTPRLAQEDGLPRRLTSPPITDDRQSNDREVVIENDIAWRLHALVDFMLGQPITMLSSAPDAERRTQIQRILDAVLENSGGMALLQDAAQIASIYGSVDFLLRTEDFFSAPVPNEAPNDIDEVIAIASRLRIEIIEPPRAIPVVSANDYRELDAYVIHFERQSTETGGTGVPPVHPTTNFNLLRALRTRLNTRTTPTSTTTEVISAHHHQRYDNDTLVHDAPNPLGVLPVVHIQNLSQPFHYDGLSDVEPLIPLQDELNTRLSDRAHRVTLQSFKLYLAKGLDDETPVRAVTPGQVWTTSNPDAAIESFGGDAASPSEDNHIQQIREAMDKASAVNPIAAGVLRAKVGQLSSENALRITLLGTLAKTQRKQLAFGRGLAQLASLILYALDMRGVYRTDPAERTVTVQWPNPLPRNEADVLDAAQKKLNLGVPRDRILAELGYAPNDEAVT